MSQRDALCKTCLRPIVWALMPNGHAHPLDPDPDEAGTIAVFWVTPAPQLLGALSDRGTRYTAADEAVVRAELISPQPDEPVLHGRYLRKGDTWDSAADEWPLMSHFATCPDAAKHRRGGAKPKSRQGGRTGGRAWRRGSGQPDPVKSATVTDTT